MVFKFDNNKKKSDKDGAGVGPDQIYESLVDRKIKIIRHHPERDDDVGPIRPQAEKKLIHDAELVQLVGVELGHEFDTGHRAQDVHARRGSVDAASLEDLADEDNGAAGVLWEHVGRHAGSTPWVHHAGVHWPCQVEAHGLPGHFFLLNNVSRYTRLN